MSSKADIRAIVAEQLTGLRALSAAGPLDQGELDRLETLAKVAVIADKVEVEAHEDETPTADLERRLG